MPARFDVIMIVDWSASSAPATGADSIWSYELDTASAVPEPLHNHRTRARAIDHLAARLAHHHGRRVLVGFDFAFGYPAGFARAAGLAGSASTVPAWQATWEHLTAALTDDDRNRNNRWDVAAELNERLGCHQFWGVPAARASRSLAATKPPAALLPATRTTERHIATQSGRRPFSVWQLLGAGAVGSQTLTGIPALQRLRTAPSLARRVRVWPFETGFTNDPCGAGDAIVLAEVWPSAIAVDQIEHPVKDARQVVALTHHLATADRDGQLAGCFHPALPPDVGQAAIAEEGWILHR